MTSIQSEPTDDPVSVMNPGPNTPERPSKSEPKMQPSYFFEQAPRLLSILRIVSAASFFTHGTMKLLSWPAPFEFPMSGMLYVAGFLEVFGGLLLIAGFFSRAVAFVLSGLMAFAYFIAHGSQGFFPVLNHGEAAILYCFLFLYISAAGPGPWSIDVHIEKIRERRATTATA